MSHKDVRVAILLADDDKIYRERIKSRLEKGTDWFILLAENATEAVTAVRETKGAIHLALIDQAMPPGDGTFIPTREDQNHGIEAAKIIGKEFPNIIVFGMSVDADQDSRLFWERRTAGFIDKHDLQSGHIKETLSKIESSLEVIDFRRNFDEGVPAEPRQKSVRVNTRMIETLLANHESTGWSLQQWADKLGCAKSTVCSTTTWREKLSPMHKLARAENQVTKRRNGRSMRE